MMKHVLLALVAIILLINCGQGYEKKANGIVLKLQPTKETDARTLQIKFCADNIVRVTASPGDKFSSRPSLIVENQDWEPVNWKLTEIDSQLVLSTAKLQVRVSPQTGEIAFLDANGNPVLNEIAGGGKSFTPAEEMGEQTFHTRQIFSSPADEAFYGLGQYQNGIMNYKGHSVDLWQYNIVAAVPFLVSSKNYGILWDNNSRTKFGDIRDYEPLSSLTLYDAKGEKGGLTAEYCNNRNFTNPVYTAKETFIDYNFLEDMGSFPKEFKLDNGSVRWSGFVESAESGVHLFRLYSSGYGQVWLNDELVVDKWRQGWLPWTNILPLNMEAGKRYPIKIEWIPDSGQAYMGLRWQSPAKEDLQNRLSLYSYVADQIDYYYIYGDNTEQVIQGYRNITGQAPVMPKWALGFWQCRQRYQTQEQLLDVVKEFRNRQIPLDNIVQDWFYWPETKWGDHDFDQERFPDPDGMVKELHDKLHTNIMISVWPKFYVGTEHFKQFEAKGWLYMRNVEKQERDWVGPGYHSTFYDPYSAGARELFWKQINEKLFSKNFDAWWLDATEPDIHSNLSDNERMLRNGPTALGTFARYANTFSLMNAKGIYEGQRKERPNQRVFILTRSAYAGQQRYSAATWSGDIAARWFDLQVQIPAGLNMSLSGIPYWTIDIGGFSTETRYINQDPAHLEEWRELNTRWFQYGAFCPLFRSHGEFPFREIFNIAPDTHPAYQAMVQYDKLRYRLMPYIYSLAGHVTFKGSTIMRALVMDFNNDQNVYNIADQFMFGPSILVNPVTEFKARQRSVYLPATTGWYDFKTGYFLPGGQTITANAPYSDIPLYIKEGSILPFGPDIQYSAEKPADPILLYVYTGKDAEFDIYEDENINYNYEKGAFSIIPVTWNEQEKTLTIHDRQGSFPGMLAERTFQVVWVSKEKAKKLDFTITPDQVIKYNGTAQSVKM